MMSYLQEQNKMSVVFSYETTEARRKWDSIFFSNTERNE